MPSAAVCVDNNSDFRITCVSVNVANTCAVVVASPPPQGVFVVTPLLLQSHIHSQRRAKTAAAATAAAAAAAASCASTSNASSGARPSNFCQSVGGAFSGRVERAVQLNSSSLFALTCADAEDRPKRLLRIVDSGARAGPAKASATSAGRPRRPPRVVAELQFSDDIVDVQWTRHNLVVVLPKAVNVFSSRTLAHRHRLPTRPCLHQQQRQSGGSGQHTPRDSVVRLCPFSPEGQHGGGHGNAPTSEQSSMWPWVKRELSSSGSTTAENAYQESLLRAGIDDLLIINDADQKEGSLTVLGLAGDQLHRLDNFQAHSAEVAMAAVNPRCGLLATVSQHGQLIRVAQLPIGKAHATCTLKGFARLLPTPEEVLHVTFHPAGNLLAAVLRRGIIAIFRVDLPGEDGAVEQASTTADSAHYPQSGSSPAGAQVSKVVRGIVGRLGGMAATFLRTQPIVSIPVELTKPRRGERGVDRSSSAKKAGTTSAQFRRTRRELGAHTGSLKPVVRVMLRDECAIDRPMSKAGWRGWTGPSASESSRNQRADADFTGVIVTVLNGRRNSVTEFAVDLADDPGKSQFVLLRDECLVDLSVTASASSFQAPVAVDSQENAPLLEQGISQPSGPAVPASLLADL